MAQVQPSIRLETALSDDDLDTLYYAILEDDLETFRSIYDDAEIMPEDTLDENDVFLGDIPMPLLFIAAGCFPTHKHYSKKIVEYLIENGANINYMAKSTEASTYSREYRGNLRVIQSDVYTTVFMNLALRGNTEAMAYFQAHGANILKETETQDRRIIQGETALQLCQRAVEKFDRYAEEERRNTLFLNKRIQVARGLRWLLNITTEKNIPKVFTSRKNYKTFEHVLKGTKGIGNLEKNYIMRLVRKPATFKVIPATNSRFKRINTSLFEGGGASHKKKTTRKTRRQRKSSQ